ncbi:ferredoxin [Paenibacillus sp. FSL E2-0201]|uniref:ferredoxin n=1 Tax=Paenibacillus sp. FSL E2-0201 TaxID=2954726 RepID=UPI0030D843C6
MKRIVVSDKCVACGTCSLESELMTERSDGKAVAWGTGMITNEQYNSFIPVLKNCPTGAISVVDDINQVGETASIIKLKKIIDEKLKSYKVKYPTTESFDYIDKEYIAPLFINKDKSGYEYSSYDRASKEGFREFERSIYSQRKTMVQSMLIGYKTKKLSSFAYYEKNSGDFYDGVCQEITKVLSEIEFMAKEITKGRIKLPDDFLLFEVGPDKDYDGELYCYKLRHTEQLDYLSEGAQPASYYDCYIDINELNDKYSFDLNQVKEIFMEHVSFELSNQLSKHIFEWMDTIINEFSKLVSKKINEKIVIIKSALKECSFEDISIKENSTSDLREELMKLIKETEKIELKKEFAYLSVDTDYDSSYRFTSESKCREAAGNRLWRFFDTCQNYFSLSYATNISEELTQKYYYQVNNIFDDFKTKLQKIYDKFEMEYPNATIQTTVKSKIVTIDFASFERLSLNINLEIRELINENVLEYGRFNYNDYLEYDREAIEIWSSLDWKKGIFGRDIEYTKYSYSLRFSGMLNGYEKACNECCKLAYEDGFLQEYYQKLMGNILQDVRRSIVNNLS